MIVNDAAAVKRVIMARRRCDVETKLQVSSSTALIVISLLTHQSGRSSA